MTSRAAGPSIKTGPGTLEVADSRVFGPGGQALARRFAACALEFDEVSSLAFDPAGARATLNYQLAATDDPESFTSASRWHCSTGCRRERCRATALARWPAGHPVSALQCHLDIRRAENCRGSTLRHVSENGLGRRPRAVAPSVGDQVADHGGDHGEGGDGRRRARPRGTSASGHHDGGHRRPAEEERVLGRPRPVGLDDPLPDGHAPPSWPGSDPRRARARARRRPSSTGRGPVR